MTAQKVMTKRKKQDEKEAYDPVDNTARKYIQSDTGKRSISL